MSLVMDDAKLHKRIEEEGTRMGVEPVNGSSSGDLEAHVRDYSKFTGMLKWGAIICFILAMLVLVVIS
jgi:hypothetical protein